MRYAYAITAALLAGGATATMVMQQPLGAPIAVPNEATESGDETVRALDIVLATHVELAFSRPFGSIRQSKRVASTSHGWE